MAALALLALPLSSASAQTNVGGDCIGGDGGDGGDGIDIGIGIGGDEGDNGEVQNGIVPAGTVVLAQLIGIDGGDGGDGGDAGDGGSGVGGDGGAGGDANCEQIINGGDVVEQAAPTGGGEEVVVQEEHVVVEEQAVGGAVGGAAVSEQQVSSVPLAQTGFDVWMLALVAGLGLTGGLALLVGQRHGSLRGVLRRNR